MRGGGWLTEDGWSASTFFDGGHDYRRHLGTCFAAITRYHAALRAQPRQAFFDTLEGPFRRADLYAFGERPAHVHPDLEAQVDALYAIRRPLVGLENQLIHGDLNPGNLLVADGGTASPFSGRVGSSTQESTLPGRRPMDRVP
jgi:aminoglycoside phosphotransferase (APT) family kinase protein